MKKIFYITCLLIITALLSFSILNNNDSSTSKSSVKNQGTCAAPTNLTATVNGSSLQLTWSAVSGVSTYSYGGYYNRTGAVPPPSVITFGGTTGGTQITITISPTLTSGTFRVTSHCSDGTTSESLPKSS